MKKGLRVLTGMFVFALMLALFLQVPLLADPSTSESGGGGAVIDSGSIEILSYEVRANSGGVYTGPINKGDTFHVWVHMQDKRETHATNGLVPYVRVNTSSFINISNSETGSTARDNVYDGGKFTVDIALQYTGVGSTLNFEVFFKDSKGSSNLPVQTITLPIGQCVEYVEPTPEEPGEIVTRGTGFVLRSASYGASEVEAGCEFTLTAELLATNGEFRVENTTVTLVLPNEIRLADGSSVFYVGTVSPNQAVQAEFALLPNATAEDGSYVVTIKISGVSGKDGTTVEASADITIPVIQPERFEISNANVPDSLMIGSNDGYSSIDLVNKGKGAVYNVEVEIVGEGLYSEDGRQFIGTIAGGGQNSVDMYIMAEMAGQLKGQILVTYENARGETKTLSYDFTVMAEDIMWDDGDMDLFPPDDMYDEGGGVPVWVWVLVVLVLAGGGVAAIIILRKRKVKKAQQELEDDLDDDGIEENIHEDF